VAEAPYEGEIERFVQRFKYPRPGLLGLDPAPEALLCALLLDAAERIDGRPPDLVVPVPQHPAGLRRRGFNPAAVLALALARARRLRFAPRVLERLRDGPSQTGLDRSARRRNVANVFRARTGIRLPPHVWLVDDVVTTGATLEAAARALRRAGARHVTGICVARTPLREAR
jgi:ComF family protein